MSIKVLFVAVFKPTSTNVSQAECLEECGCEVVRYDYREKAAELGYLKSCNDIVNNCYKEKPDLVIFSKCNTLPTWIIEECNKFGSSTCLWYMDPLNGNYNYNLKNHIKKASFSCMALTKPYEEARKLSKNVYFVHEGFDPKRFYPIANNYIHDVSFIGNINDHKRSKYFKEVEFYNYTDAYNELFSKAISESKINLNFVRGEDGTSDRTYCILACRGFLLTEKWPGMVDDFVDGVDFVTFDGAKDLKEKIDYWVNNESGRIKISNHGYETVQKFSRITWARKILDIYKDNYEF
jgi:hypothetical protein